VETSIPQKKVPFVSQSAQPRVLGDIQHWLEKQGHDCSSMADAELQELNLCKSRLVGRGNSLIESIREGRGPRGFCLMDTLSRGSYIAFMNALESNSYVERLDVSRKHSLFLCASLRKNKGLTHLSLRSCKSPFMQIGRSLLEPAYGGYFDSPVLASTQHGHYLDLSAKQGRTMSIVNMLLVNKRVDEIPFEAHTLDQAL
jgi:hypothetical protein